MFPGLEGDYIVNIALRNLVFLGKTRLGNITAVVFGANLIDQVIRKFRAALSTTLRGSPLGFAVSHIITVSPKEKMIWPDAYVIVTGMTHFQSISYRSIVYLVRYPMGLYQAAINLKLTIAIFTGLTFPNPTDIRPLYFSPKPNFKWDSRPMTSNVVVGGALDPVMSCGCMLDNLCRLATATLTKAQGNGRIGLHSEAPFVVPFPGLLAQRQGFLKGIIA